MLKFIKNPNSPNHIFYTFPITTMNKDGADRYVAKGFIDLKFKQKSLAVLLPFSTSRYQKDFDKNSQLEFNSILNQAGSTFTVESKSDSGYLDIMLLIIQIFF